MPELYFRFLKKVNLAVSSNIMDFLLRVSSCLCDWAEDSVTLPGNESSATRSKTTHTAVNLLFHAMTHQTHVQAAGKKFISAIRDS